MKSEYALRDCVLCPRDCHVDRDAGEIGYCGVTSELRVARAALHMWEEPCISGEAGSGTVFFSGCNLHCVYCQNYHIAHAELGKAITVERLAEIFGELQAKGALNINLVTPSHYVPQIVEALTIAKARGLSLPVVYNSSAYEKADALRLLDGLVDVYLPDLKYVDSAISKKYSHAADYFTVATAALAEMVRQVGEPLFDDQGIMRKGVIVRHLLLPGCLWDSKAVIRYLYETYGDQIYISIMNQYTPLPHVACYPELDRKITPEEYDELVNYALDLGVENGFIQEGDTALESFIPDFDDEGV